MSVSSSLVEPAVEAGDVAAECTCFHCGLVVPPGSHFRVVIDGKPRLMCCRGCEAVAEAIVEAGLSDFYHHRTAPSLRAEDLIPDALRGLELYDRPDLQQRFVRTDGDLRDASLILEGIVCAACVWLNERHVGRLPGVVEFRVNYSTHRAHIRWDDRQIHLSQILAAVAAIGYRAHPFDPERQETLQRQERAVALRRVAVAGLFSMQVMMFAVALYAADYSGMDADLYRFFRWISLLFSIPVVLYSARPFFTAAARDLQRRQLGMDVPVALAIGLAFVASAWNTWLNQGQVYFDSVTMFTFLLLGSRFLEMTARHRAARLAEAQVRPLPATAVRLRADGGEDTVPVAELITGDRVLIRPGDTVPADGRVVEGTSSVDESLLTGESLPIAKTIGTCLIGGSVNVESPLILSVERVGADTVLSAILRLLDRAQSEKPRLAQLADRAAAGFVAALLVIAAVVSGYWWLHDSAQVFPVLLAVLVVTCPCALSLATPAAITAGTGTLIRLGLLTTRGHAVETLARATHILFDKTGTLTWGRPQLVNVEPLRELDRQQCLAIASALERGSEHPVGRALANLGAGVPAEQMQNTPGRGVEGSIDGRRYRIGKPDFVAELSDIPAPAVVATDEPGSTRITLGDEQGLLAWLQLADELRPQAAETVTALQQLGLHVILLSGDQPDTVTAIARRLGITEARGGLLPEDKLAYSRELQRRGAVVAMVGDGVNDAPVLAAAAVSIALGSGTVVAQTTADMVLLSENLGTLVQGVKTTRRTLTIIRENLGWAILYNVIALPLAAGGWLTPWMAAVGMSLSSLLVVGNALRLRTVDGGGH
jgi:Cu2+-exporting ATPase